jgi:DnaJ family protein C protein 9
MTHIPHSSTADEPRFINLINEAISAGNLDDHSEWKTSSADQKGRKERVRKEKKEAKEAEAAAREMGVWDEFYGDKAGGAQSTKAEDKAKETGKRGTKRKPASTTNGGEEEGDISALAALIGKRQQSRASAFDALLDKYSAPQADEEKGKRGKGSKRGKRVAEEEGDAALPVSLDSSVLLNGG